MGEGEDLEPCFLGPMLARLMRLKAVAVDHIHHWAVCVCVCWGEGGVTQHIMDFCLEETVLGEGRDVIALQNLNNTLL